MTTWSSRKNGGAVLESVIRRKVDRNPSDSLQTLRSRQAGVGAYERLDPLTFNWCEVGEEYCYLVVTLIRLVPGRINPYDHTGDIHLRHIALKSGHGEIRSFLTNSPRNRMSCACRVPPLLT